MSLKKRLLELERDPENKELVEKVFRIMHSLKGGGAMFGFEKISEFTHNLENVYDFVRTWSDVCFKRFAGCNTGFS